MLDRKITSSQKLCLAAVQLLFVLMITTGAISISQALMVNQTLLELHMLNNNQSGDDGITAIAGSLSNSSISITVLSVGGVASVLLELV